MSFFLVQKKLTLKGNLSVQVAPHLINLRSHINKRILINRILKKIIQKVIESREKGEDNEKNSILLYSHIRIVVPE